MMTRESADDIDASVASAPESQGWSTVAASTFGLTFGPSTILVFTFGVFIQPLQTAFGWSVPSIALGATVISLMLMVAVLLQGFLADRISTRRLVLTSIPLFACSLCSLYFLNGPVWHFYAALVLVCLCGLGVWPVTYMRATAHCFDRRLGLALGISNAGVGIGAAILPVSVGLMIAHSGWRGAYLGLAMLALAVWPVAFLLLKDTGRASVPGHHHPESGALRETWSSGTFWIMVGAFFLLGAVSSAAIVHQIKILMDARVSLATATVVQSALGAALIVSRIGTGWLLDRFKASYVMAALAIGAGIACALYALGLGAVSAIPCAILLGLVIGGETDVLSYIIPRYQGRHVFGRVYGLVFAAFQLSSAFAAVALGVARAHSGSYANSLWVLSGAMVVCAALFLSLGPYRFAASRTSIALVPEPAGAV